MEVRVLHYPQKYKIMNTFTLKPTDSRKSFYNKAIVLKKDNISYLKSYETIVAEYNHETNEINVYNWYSATAARHINAFLNYFGFESMTKKRC